MPPFAASFFCNFRQIKRLWRKRVGVEPTPESAKDTGYGFEDHEDHRAPFASVIAVTRRTQKPCSGMNIALNMRWPLLIPMFG